MLVFYFLRESEKTNSSTERSLSKTMNTNQTMCPDINMSVSMLDEANDNPQDYEKTRCGENDMSFDQTGILPRRRVSICPTNQVKYVIIILHILFYIPDFFLI